MNHQNIEILVNKAELYAGKAFAVNTPSWKLAYNHKFTELLVLECETLAKDSRWYSESPSDGWRNPINHVCRTFKAHFGV